MSFYGHDKLRKRRREAASGAAVGSKGQREGGEAVWEKGEGLVKEE